MSKTKWPLHWPGWEHANPIIFRLARSTGRLDPRMFVKLRGALVMRVRELVGNDPTLDQIKAIATTLDARSIVHD